jgi:ribonuclease III
VLKELYKKIRLLLCKNKEPYSSLYKILGFYPDKPDLYQQAFIHKSAIAEGIIEQPWRNNERLEFLGDAILSSVIADILYIKFQNKREGFLTNTRSKIVQRETLNRVAMELGLDKHIVCAKKMHTHGNDIYGNVLEALIGAIYLDQGYKVCHKFVSTVIIGKYINIDKLARKEVNFKSALIEWSQKTKLDISFNLVESFTDEESNPIFQYAVMLGETQLGIGIGFSKKEAQQNASKMAIKKIRKDPATQEIIANLKKSFDPDTTVSDEINGKEKQLESVDATKNMDDQQLEKLLSEE